MEDLLQVGAIANTHGVAGEVKVYPMTDDVNRFKDLKEVYLETDSDMMLLHVVSCKFVKNQPVLKFKEFNNINQVEIYKRNGLFVTRENAAPLGENEYYIADLIGLTVLRDDDMSELGQLSDVLQTAANDVYVVSKEGKKDVLLPVIPDCIKKIDIEAGQVVAHIMKGLLDE